MAKKPTSVTAGLVSLAAIIAATDSETGFIYVPEEQANKLASEGLIVLNNDLRQDGGIAAKITDAGRAKAAAEGSTEAAGDTAAASDDYEIEYVAVPEKKRAPRKPTESKYPFAKLEAPVAGQPAHAFFIPSTAERPEPWKTLNSTVATAQDAYHRVVGEKEVTRKVRGSTTGETQTIMQKIKEYDREFRIFEGMKMVDDGNGGKKSVKGAYVARVK